MGGCVCVNYFIFLNKTEGAELYLPVTHAASFCQLAPDSYSPSCASRTILRELCETTGTET